jgi:2-haloalkanoic acid dehalogenase type II
MTFDLTKYKLLSFDIYATLIDWESGIYQALQPLIERIPADSPYHPSAFPSPSAHRAAVLRAYRTHEHELQTEQPTLLYSPLLALLHTRLATRFSAPPDDAAALAFASSIAAWPAFPDSVAAMRVLGTHYRLAALSNVDHASFALTRAGPLAGVRFDAVYTAQDIGAYKPDHANFRFLIARAAADFALGKDRILHVAQSLLHDHVPAKAVGLSPGIWIARGAGGADGGGDGGCAGSVLGGSLHELGENELVDLAATYKTLGDFAAAVEKAFAERGGG